MSHTALFVFNANFPKGVMLFEAAFHREICIRFFIFPSSMFSLKVFIVFRLRLVNLNMSATFCFIFCSMTAFFEDMPIFIDLFVTSKAVVWRFLLVPRFPRLAFNLSATLASWFSSALLALPEVMYVKDFTPILVLRFPKFCWNTERFVTTNRLKTP